MKTKVLSTVAAIALSLGAVTAAGNASARSYGYGLGNYHSIHAGFVFHGHGGDADGYLSNYGYNLDTGLVYFIVINAFRAS